MKTTAVFAEIMAVGLQVMCWIALAFYAFGAFNTEAIDWATLGDWSALITTAILALAYTAGVLMDRVADKVVRTRGPRTKDFGTVRLTLCTSGAAAW